MKHTEDLSKPVLLIVDGLQSHFGVATLNLALQKNMYVFNEKFLLNKKEL